MTANASLSKSNMTAFAISGELGAPMQSTLLPSGRHVHTSMTNSVSASLSSSHRLFSRSEMRPSWILGKNSEKSSLVRNRAPACTSALDFIEAPSLYAVADSCTASLNFINSQTARCTALTSRAGCATTRLPPPLFAIVKTLYRRWAPCAMRLQLALDIPTSDATFDTKPSTTPSLST